jgi:hypothetical protein
MNQCLSQPTAPDYNDYLAAMIELSQSGCRLESAGLSGDMPTIRVDRRPNLPDLIPGCLRADAAGCYYQARLGAVRVAWTEARRA